MKSIEKANTSEHQKSKMTLRDYYKSLPDANTIAPRKALIRRISERCEVPESTARSWLIYNIRPRDSRAIEILSEETGIAPDNMWDKN